MSFDDLIRQVAAEHHREMTDQAIAHVAEVGRLKERIAELERQIAGPSLHQITVEPGKPQTIEQLVAEQNPGAWIEWNGGECPVPKGTLVDVMHANGKVHIAYRAMQNGAAYNWSRFSADTHIVAYRVHQPAGIDSEGGAHD